MPKIKKTETVKKPVKKAKTEIVEKTVAAPKVAVKKGDLAIDVFDTKGNVSESMTLPKDMFGVKVNKALLAQAVRVYLANQRVGSHSTKTRGEVTGSTRKIYRQKGTGRARHGAVSAPIFVHGGVAHGPKPVDYSLSLSQPMKRLALFSALSAASEDKGLTVLAGLEKLTPKTKTIVKLLEKLSLVGEKKGKHEVLFVKPEDSENMERAVRNIAGVTTIRANQLNAYDVLVSKHIVFAKEAVDLFISHFSKKEKKENAAK